MSLFWIAISNMISVNITTWFDDYHALGWWMMKYIPFILPVTINCVNYPRYTFQLLCIVDQVPKKKSCCSIFLTNFMLQNYILLSSN